MSKNHLNPLIFILSGICKLCFQHKKMFDLWIGTYLSSKEFQWAANFYVMFSPTYLRLLLHYTLLLLVLPSIIGQCIIFAIPRELNHRQHSVQTIELTDISGFYNIFDYNFLFTLQIDTFYQLHEKLCARRLFFYFVRSQNMKNCDVWYEFIFAIFSTGPSLTRRSLFNTVSTATVFCICTCKWGIFALVGNPLQSHSHEFHVTWFFPSPKMCVRQGLSVT